MTTGIRFAEAISKAMPKDWPTGQRFNIHVLRGRRQATDQDHDETELASET